MSKSNFFKIVIFASLFLSAIDSQAGSFEHSASFIGRTTPLAGQFEVAGGYGQLLWGQGQLVNPWYGYIRPTIALRGPTSPTGVVSVDIFPISFLGITLGRNYSQRWIDTPGMNCDQAHCRGSLNQNFVRARLVGKMGAVFAALNFEKTFYDDHKNIQKPIGQGTNIVYLAPRDERGDEWFLTTGYEIDDVWSVGITAQDFRTHISKNEQSSQMFFLRLKKEAWSYAVAAGRFQSSQFHAAPEFSLVVNWAGSPAIGY